jgi:signal transduction histidine kinase
VRYAYGDRMSRRVWAVDAAVAAFLCAVMVAELAAKPLEPGERASSVPAYVLAAAVALPFAVHRRFPVATLAVTGAATVAYALGRFTAFPGYAVFALVFGVSLHADRRRAALALATGLAALAGALSLQTAPTVTASTWVSTGLATTVAWLAGENMRVRRERVVVLEERARRLEAEREDRARRAVNDERLRIARELHDVVAHSMSVIAVQAGVAHHVVDSRPEVARQALATVETTSRAALVEMRRLLGVLRQGDEPQASLTPAPGLADVPALVDQFAEAGLTVRARLDDAPGEVPDGVDLSAYRIVQEGLTNVLRHGGPTAEIDITYLNERIVVQIDDDGPLTRHRPASSGAGHGLIGMRERVAVFHGSLDAGPTGEGGYRLVATLPYGPGRAGATGTGPTAPPHGAGGRSPGESA